MTQSTPVRAREDRISDTDHDLVAGPRSALPMARLVSSWPTSSVAIVGATGDIDVTNAATMTNYALGHARNRHGLVLDLSGVVFFGTEGFSAVHRVAVGCARAGTALSIVPGGAVRRLLRICDPQGFLPAAGSVDVALAAVQHQMFTDRNVFDGSDV